MTGRSALLVLIVLASAGCQAQVGHTTIPRGSGNLKTESRHVSGFERVMLSGIGTLTITQGASESLTVRAEDNLLSLLRSDVTGGTLQIGPKPDTQLVPTRPITYNLAVKRLSGIDVSGAADVRAATLDTDQLKLMVSGASHVTLGRVTAASLTAIITGGSEVTASGQAPRQDVAISGAGKYLASGLSSQQATVEVSGAGDCEVQVTDHLSATASGASHIAYSGTPVVDQQVTGASSITRSG